MVSERKNSRARSVMEECGGLVLGAARRAKQRRLWRRDRRCRRIGNRDLPSRCGYVPRD